MIETFDRNDEGQALVIVGIAMVVLMGALVLAVDWGFGLATRRAAQNQADSAALAAGRLLATTYVGPTDPFGASEEQVWNAACLAHNANVFGPAGQVWDLRVSFFDGVSWTPLSYATTDCSRSGNTDVPPGTFAVRAEASTTYASLFGMVSHQSIAVAASAQARLTAGAAVRQLRLPPANGSPVGMPGLGLSGYTTAPNAAIWPLVVYYGNWDPEDPTISLIRSGRSGRSTDGNVYIAPSHFSLRAAPAQTHQLVTESDYTGSVFGGDHGHPPAGPLPNAGPSSCGPTWDTNGGQNLADAATCDVPNWFYYGYRGSLSVSTNWTPGSPAGWGDPATRTGFEGNPDPLESPAPFPQQRASCGVLASAPFLTTPSCTPDRPGSSQIGDWVETVPRASVDERVIHDEITSFIERYGRDVPGGGDKSVVVNVFLWDCAESYDAARPAGSRWQLDPVAGDCSADPDFATADRVHLFAVVPMTIFESEVDLRGPNLRLTAHWGDVFGDAGPCAALPPPTGCDLNPLMNSAFLVPDE